MAETPEQKYNRIAAAVQQTILNNFPNPNRVGCPGDARVREVAARTAIVEDDDWQHITHCSECYREFLAAKEELRRSSRRTRTLGLIGGTTLLVIVAALAGYRYIGETGLGRENLAATYVPATLDLHDISEVRGSDKPVQHQIPTLSARALDLTVTLPFASEAGSYEFELTDGEGRIIRRGTGNAAIRNGDTAFTTRLDLIGVTPGDYRFGWRQKPFDWVATPVIVRSGGRP